MFGEKICQANRTKYLFDYFSLLFRQSHASLAHYFLDRVTGLGDTIVELFDLFMTSIAMSRLLVTAGFTAVAFLRFSFGSASTPHLRHPTDDVDDITHVAAASSAKLSNFVYTDEANADKIIDLPGLAYDPGFNQFSGYLTVNEDHGRKIHYWYVESQGDPSKDPVVFWTNGGPGCSGLLGLGTEHGPFFIDRKGNLHPNAYAWNQVASILYVEQPAGVGFSYSDTESDYTTGDKQAADDNYVLIQQFLKRFPERQSNDFYVSSESYGGHYIPQLTKEILDRNQDGSINFKGFLVGNPFVDYWSNMVTMYAAFYSHGLLAKPLYQKWVENCSDKDNYDEEVRRHRFPFWGHSCACRHPSYALASKRAACPPPPSFCP